MRLVATSLSHYLIQFDKKRPIIVYTDPNIVIFIFAIKHRFAVAFIRPSENLSTQL